MNIIYHFRVKGVGPERVHISGIAGALQNLGHSVSFVSPTDINPLESGDVAPQKGGLRSLLYFLADKMPQVFFEFMEIFYNVMAIKKLKGKIADVKPQLIYERYAFFCFAGIYLSRKKNIPIVLEVNEVGGFDRVRPQKLVTLSKLFEKYIFSKADVIVTVSDFLKEQIIQRGGNKDSILIVPNGIDTTLFDKQTNSVVLKKKHGISDSKIVGFVGYLVHWHCLDMLIEVFTKIRLKHPETKLIFVGDGVLRNDLEMLAKSLRIESDLIITGRVDHSEVPEYIDLFDVAIIPNSNEYRSPIKMFEYMAMGKAIVAPNQPPILGVLQDGITGFIFKNGDKVDLTSKIDLVLTSEETCANVGRNARMLVRDRYTWNIHAANILQFLSEKTKM
jgi:glycosyltransferase involved in cell wall biosynthesis